MTPFDWIIVGILGFFFVLGIWHGLSEQVAGILRVVLGVTAATPLSYLLAPHLGDHRFLAWGAAYLVIWLGAFVVARIYQESIEDEEDLLWLDRIVGGFVGALKGVLICLALSFIVVSNSDWARKKVLSTPSGKVMATTLNAIDIVLPEGAHEKLHPYLHHLDEEKEEASPDKATDDEAGDEEARPAEDVGHDH